MHTPTVLHSTTDVRDALCAAFEGMHSSNGSLDLGLFFEETRPLILVKGPIYNQDWLVTGDGTIAVVHYGHIDTYDMDIIRRMDHPNPIGLFLAAAGAADTHGAPHSGTIDPMGTLLGQSTPWRLKAASSGTLNLTAEPLAIEEAQALLDGFLEMWSADMEDPFFAPGEEQIQWTKADALSLEATTIRLLNATGCATGTYRIEGQEEGKNALVVDADGEMCEKLQAITAILALLYPNTSFQGVAWEYNDGASDRASGYDSTAPMVCEIDHDAPNAHTQLASQQKVAALLAKAGPEAQSIWDQLSTKR